MINLQYGAGAIFAALVSLTFLISTVRAGDFLYPTRGGLEVFNGDNVNVSYTSDYIQPILAVFCREDTSSDDITPEASFTDIPAKNGWHVVNIAYNVQAKSCWFNIRDQENQDEDLGFNSVSWSLSSKDRPEATTLGPSATHAPTKTGKSTSSTGAAKTNDATTDDDGDSSPGKKLSTGATVGIGVGVGVGVLALFGAAMAFWLVRRRRAKGDVNQTTNGGVDRSSGHGSYGYTQGGYKPELDATSAPSHWPSHSPQGHSQYEAELEARHPPSELAG